MSLTISGRAREIEGGFTLIELMIVVAIIGVLAVLAIFGVSKYLKNAKTGEATNALGRINEDAVMVYDKETAGSTVGPGAGGGASRQLCPSSKGAIPPAPPKNSLYTADPVGDYALDPGFSCLGFMMNQPQYFAYDYTRGGGSAVAGGAIGQMVNAPTGWATGAAADFSGDGVNFVEFATGGSLINGEPITSTAIASYDVASKQPF